MALAAGLVFVLTAISGSVQSDSAVASHGGFWHTIELLSVATDGTQGNGNSSNFGPSESISNDGRFVAFLSYASNLVPGDTNGQGDVFVRDRQTNQTTRISVSSGGMQGNGASFAPSISADGRYVVFMSWASNLVPEDTNGRQDVFLHDRQTAQTTRVSVASDGSQGNDHSQYPSINFDGRYVVFNSSASNLISGDTNNTVDIFVYDRITGETARVSIASDGSQANGGSYGPRISDDGRYVAFSSHAANLVSGDTNGHGDIFVHDRDTNQTSRVSVASDGTPGNNTSRWPSINANGIFVAFDSFATNLVPGDTNGVWDVFVAAREMPAVDSDGDGVSDDEDVCPNTPSGETVDEYGCSREQNEWLLAEKFQPKLMMYAEDYKPEDIRIMLSSELSPADAEARLTRAIPGPDFVESENPTLLNLCASVDSQNTYLDLKVDHPKRVPSKPLDQESYMNQYKVIERLYPDTLYARVFSSIDHIALQYWFFYYFNDWRNNHEGDWEQITIVFNSGNLSAIVHEGIKPDRVGYSQHNRGMHATWEKLESLGEISEGNHPNVYVALGSHANYFQSGDYYLERIRRDQARGASSLSYKIQLLPDDPQTVTCEEGGWLEYAGRWGELLFGTGTSGPRGPKFQEQNTWNDPIGWVDERTDELWGNCERAPFRCRIP